MTREEIEALCAIAEQHDKAATAGPWGVDGGGDVVCARRSPGARTGIWEAVQILAGKDPVALAVLADELAKKDYEIRTFREEVARLRLARGSVRGTTTAKQTWTTYRFE